MTQELPVYVRRQHTEIYDFGVLHDLLDELNADNDPPTFWTGKAALAKRP